MKSNRLPNLLVFAVCAVMFAPGAARAVTYGVTDLTPYADGVGTLISAHVISPDGQYIAGNVNVGGKYHAFRYHVGDAAISDVNYGQQSYATGVNNSGQVAGSYNDGDVGPNNDHLFINTPGSGTTLPPAYYPLQDISHANSINADGHVAGTSLYQDNQGVWCSYLMYYDGTTVRNAAPGVSNKYGHDIDYYDINDSSSIVAHVGWGDGTSSGLLNSDDGLGGRVTTYPAFNPSGAGTNALGINNSGQIISVGWPALDDDRMHVFLWEPNFSSVQDVGRPAGADANPVAINDNGWIVGNAMGGSAGWTFLAMDEGSGYVFHDLDDLLTPSDQAYWKITSIQGLSETGHIIATATHDFEFEHPVLLTPVPEPGTLALLLSAAGFLIAARKRGHSTFSLVT